MTKKEQARQIALAHPEATRQELIELFIENIPGISAGGASTYASSVKKDVIANAAYIANVHPVVEESDEEIDKRLSERFEMIDLLANASTLGQIRSLVISGPGGLGKSYVVEKALQQYDPEQKKSIIAKGYVRATGLYLLLHEYRHPGNVIVLDDSDAIFSDEISLNLLKGALDTTHKRIINWRSETRMQDADGNDIERSFEFNGSLIFITNKDIEKEASNEKSKMAPHYEALLSRSHYVSCDMFSMRDYIVRIRQVVAEGMLRTKDISHKEESILMSFLENNAEKFRELTLRLVLKLADVYKVNPDNFESLAKVSLFKGGVRH